MAYNKAQKLQDNIAAIRVVLTLRKEGRQAGDDERAVLRKYSGFGGLKFILNPANNTSDIDHWKMSDRHYFGQVRELYATIHELSADAREEQELIASIKRSVNTAFYTPTPVIDGITNGLADGKIAVTSLLDPSAGIGKFGDSFAKRNAGIKVTAFEKDLLTGRILEALHPQDSVTVDGFETIDARQKGRFDLVTSNIPFGDIAVFDPEYSRSENAVRRSATSAIHNYFFLKSLDMVREGGIVAFITSRGVMDSPSNEAVRREMLSKANLVSALRLPDGMFRDEAGTDVGSDLIVLQKDSRKNLLSAREEDFVSTIETEDGITTNGFYDTRKNILSTDIVVGTDPYGKPAYVYKWDESMDLLSEAIADRLAYEVDLTQADIYYETTKPHVQVAPKPVVQAVSQPEVQAKPKVKQPQSGPVQLDLFAMWDEQEAQPQPQEEAVQRPSLEPRDYEGELKDYYRDGNVVEDPKTGQLGVLSDYRTVFKPLSLTVDQEGRMRQYLLIRDSYQELYNTEAETRKEQPELREELNRHYDNFFLKYGHLNERKNSRVIMMDAMGRDSLTLENPQERSFVKADIFERPVSFVAYEISHVDTPEEALFASLNRYGVVDLEYMSGITGHSEEELIDLLKGRIYYNPTQEVRGGVPGEKASYAYETAERFLSGNVYQKLDRLQAFYKDMQEALPDSPFTERVKESVDALQQTIPQQIPFDDIGLQFGERWIPTSYYEDYIGKLFNTQMEIHYAEHIDEYSLKAKDRYNLKIREEYCVRGEYKDYDGMALLAHAFHDTTPDIQKCVGYDDNGDDVKGPDMEKIQLAQSKIQEIREGFTEYLTNLPREKREELQAMYNRKFNCFVKAHYDGGHQTFPGIDMKALASPKFNVKDIYKSQKDCVWMILQNGGGICDHEVGTGKTLIMCMAAHEMHRLGIANKPMIIALKANVAEIAATYQAAFPDDKILYASEKDFSPANRLDFFNRIKNNDYACVIMSHDQFGKIPQSMDIQRQILDDEIRDIDEALDVLRREGGNISGRMLTGLEKRKENLQVKIQNMQHDMAQRKDDFVDFGNMGIDHILVDESHQFKNLMFTTRHQRVSGLGNPTGSQKALNLLYAIRTIQKRTGKDLGATFLSGTTISNSLTELYLLFKYLRPQAMAEQGIHSFDAWAAVYAKKTSDYEFSVTNAVVQKERFRYFVKVPELAMFYNEITDYRTGEDVGLDRPAMNVVLHNIKPTADQQDFNQRLVQFAQTGDGELIFRAPLSDREKKGKMLIATDASRKAALDMRLVDPELFGDDPDNKASHCAKLVAEYYQKYNEHKGTQFIFSDLSTWKPGEWNVFQEIKDKLVNDYGIPENEIRFIQEAKNQKQREAIIKGMNDGTIRVLFGSTSTLGTGVNAQKRAVAAHHIDIPWRPSDLEQRDGRARRSGNEVAKLYADNNVDIIIYAVERTLDSYKFNLLQNKQLFITQLKTNQLGTRVIDEGAMDEENGMNFAEYVAILSGNDDLLQKAKLEKRILALESERKTYMQARRETEWRLELAQEKLSKNDTIIKNMTEDSQRYLGQRGLGEDGTSLPGLKVQNVNEYTSDGVYNIEGMGETLQDAGRTVGNKDRQVGTVYGFPLIVDSIYMYDTQLKKDVYAGNKFYVKGHYQYEYNNGKMALSKENRLAAVRYGVNALEKIPSYIKQYEERNEKLRADIAEYERIAGKPWGKEEELKNLRREMEALDKKIQASLDETNKQQSKPKELPYKFSKEGRYHTVMFAREAYPLVAIKEMRELADTGSWRNRGFIRCGHWDGDVMVSDPEVIAEFSLRQKAEEFIQSVVDIDEKRQKDTAWLVEMAKRPIGAQVTQDNEVVFAARRILQEQGIDWNAPVIQRAVPVADTEDLDGGQAAEQAPLEENAEEQSRRFTVYSVGRYGVGEQGEELRTIAHQVKEFGTDSATNNAVTKFVGIFNNLPEADKKRMVLIPVPGSTGYPSYMDDVVYELGERLNMKSANHLYSNAHDSLYELKKQGVDYDSLPEINFHVDEPLPAGTIAVLVDNVLDTGRTLSQALQAEYGDGVEVRAVVLANTDNYKEHHPDMEVKQLRHLQKETAARREQAKADQQAQYEAAVAVAKNNGFDNLVSPEGHKVLNLMNVAWNAMFGKAGARAELARMGIDWQTGGAVDAPKVQMQVVAGVTETEKSMLSQIASDLETGNHLLGRPRPDGYRELLKEVFASFAAIKDNSLTIRQRDLLNVLSEQYHDGYEDVARHADVQTSDLMEALNSVESRYRQQIAVKPYSIYEEDGSVVVDFGRGFGIADDFARSIAGVHYGEPFERGGRTMVRFENERNARAFIENVRQLNESYTDKVRDALIDRLRSAGIRVSTDVAEGQRILDMENGRSTVHVAEEFVTPELRIINDSFNSMLSVLTTENANNLAFQLGIPNVPMKEGGVQDKPLKLYGNKILAKQRKHGFSLEELRNLPIAVANPIAIFNNYGSETNRSILTELRTKNGNFLVSVEVGDGVDIDFNIVSSVFGKGDINIVDWLKSGYATYINNEKVQNFLSYHSALIAGASAKSEPLSDAKVQQISELNKLLGEKLYIRTKNFKEWFGNWEKVSRENFWYSEETSKVVDESFNPKVVLHGTPNKGFYEFDESHSGNTTDAGWLGKGFYFYGNNPDYARQYAGPDGRVLEVYLNIRNPYIATAEDFNRLSEANSEEESRIFRESLEAEGYDGVFYNGDLNEEWVAFYPNQIKSATENIGTYRKDVNDIRFMLVPTGPIFISNARRAVERINQPKATPEQWLRMIEKNGGIKSGEDRWTGFFDWLRNSQERTLTKQQVLDYINENQIQVEEVHYSENADSEGIPVDLQTKFFEYYDDERSSQYDNLVISRGEEYAEEYFDNIDYDRDDQIAEKAFDRLVKEYGDDFRTAFSYYREPGEGYFLSIDNAEAAESIVPISTRPIDSTRLDYTTSGLNNRREIALTVPSIEAWGEEDTLHFGDADGGRAVAWVRFGETVANKPGSEDTERVLVIDEIQSKRHQEGRAHGYITAAHQQRLELLDNRINEAAAERDKYHEELRVKYGLVRPENFSFSQIRQMNAALEGMITREEREQYQALASRVKDRQAVRALYRTEHHFDALAVPDAPFEKNWHELAMKRILRYAAENGYDRVAWTTGDQQAERYNIGEVVSYITSEPYVASSPNEVDGFDVSIDTGTNASMDLFVTKDGIIQSGTYGKDDLFGRKLSDFVGKPLAEKILAVQEWERFSGDDLRVGADGMKSFYDHIIPNFVNKYCKQWGVHTEMDSSLDPNMHSVAVNDQMKNDVLQGQPQFFRAGNRQAYGFVNDGTVYIDMRLATAETPIHEYTHLWAAALRENNRAEWDNIVQMMKDTPEVWNYVRSQYPHLHTDDQIADEALAQFSGQRGYKRLQEFVNGKDNPEGIFEKVSAILGRFWNAVADFLHIHYTSKEEVADRVLYDFLNGVNPLKEGVSNLPRSFHFIGEKGATNLDVAYDGMNISFLRHAEKLEKVGRSPRDIKIETGWERSADGHWTMELPAFKQFNAYGNVEWLQRHPDTIRYLELLRKENAHLFGGSEDLTLTEREEYERLKEFPDNRYFEPGVTQKNKEMLSVQDFVDAPMLFAAYPELRTMPVRIEEMEDRGAYATRQSIVDGSDIHYIRLNRDMVEQAQGMNASFRHQMESTLAHEIQHYIQEQEGFARGNDIRRINGATDFEMNVAAFDGFIRGEGMEVTYQELMSRLKDDGYADWRSEFGPGYQTMMQDLIRMSGNMTEQQFMDNYEYFRVNGEKGEAWLQYWNSAGETQARNVQNRLGMTIEERRHSLASDTEDVPRDRQIFTFDTLIAASREPDIVMTVSMGSPAYLGSLDLQREVMALGGPDSHVIAGYEDYETGDYVFVGQSADILSAVDRKGVGELLNGDDISKNSIYLLPMATTEGQRLFDSITPQLVRKGYRFGIIGADRVQELVDRPESLDIEVEHPKQDEVKQESKVPRVTSAIQLDLFANADFGNEATVQTAVKAAEPQDEENEVRGQSFDPTQLSMRQLHDGEQCYVERRYSESGYFSFVGGNHIESNADVAYIFRSLEDKSVENSFICMVKDGKPTVIHLGIGDATSVMAPIQDALLAYKALEPDKIWFIHNHPSGNLKVSQEDFRLQQRMENIFGAACQPGIIINTTSGQFMAYTSEFEMGGEHRISDGQSGNESVKTYSFDRNVFEKDWNPLEAFKGTSYADVAKFVSSHRLGEHEKLSLLVMNQNGSITGNVFLPWADIKDVCTNEGVDLISQAVLQMGGNRCLLYGSEGAINGKEVKALNILQKRLRDYAITLHDVTSVERSLRLEGIIASEPMERGIARDGSVGEQNVPVSVPRKLSMQERETGGAMVDHLRAMGIEVITDSHENRRTLREAERNQSEVGKVRHFKTENGESYGYAYNGRIHLDLRKMDAELSLHEYAHLWCEAMRRINPQNWNNIVSIVKNDTETWNFVKAAYPELQDENDIVEEVIAHYSGKRGAEKLQVELERMTPRDDNYKSRWNNIFQNISKAIQDFWKHTGDSLNVEYKDANDVADMILKDFANKVSPVKKLEKHLQEQDKEYAAAVVSGDMDKARELFVSALQEHVGNGVTPFVAVDGYRGKLDYLARNVKSDNIVVKIEAINEAADRMAPLVGTFAPDKAVLVPAPSHEGKATDMLALANAISGRTGIEVADVLKSNPRQSQYEAKRETGKALTADQLGIRMEGGLPQGKMPIVIDNVVNSGNTAEACVNALGKGMVLSIASATSQERHVASLKSAATVAYDRQGQLIPLSERFELKNKWLGIPMNYKPLDGVMPTVDQPQAIQGLEGYDYEDVELLVEDYVNEILGEQFPDEDVYVKEVTVIGSRTRGEAHEGSDLDILLEYGGADVREDTLFNVLHEEPFEIEGITVDINPINEHYSLNTADWLARDAQWREQDRQKQNNHQNSTIMDNQELSQNVQAEQKELLAFYRQMKSVYENEVVLLRQKGFMEAFGKDAELAAEKFDVPIYERTIGESKVPFVLVPNEKYVDMLEDIDVDLHIVSNPLHLELMENITPTLSTPSENLDNGQELGMAAEAEPAVEQTESVTEHFERVQKMVEEHGLAYVPLALRVPVTVEDPDDDLEHDWRSENKVLSHVTFADNGDSVYETRDDAYDDENAISFFSLPEKSQHEVLHLVEEMLMNQDQQITVYVDGKHVPDWALNTIVNGDITGLTDDERIMVEEFTDQYKNCILSPRDQSEGFIPFPAFGQGADCTKVDIVRVATPRQLRMGEQLKAMEAERTKRDMENKKIIDMGINPINANKGDVNVTIKRLLEEKDDTFRYQLLSRMQSDVKYFLGNGNRHEPDLWAGNAKDHIIIMDALMHSLPEPPQWLSTDMIIDYADQMGVGEVFGGPSEGEGEELKPEGQVYSAEESAIIKEALIDHLSQMESDYYTRAELNRKLIEDAILSFNITTPDQATNAAHQVSMSILRDAVAREPDILERYGSGSLEDEAIHMTAEATLYAEGVLYNKQNGMEQKLADMTLDLNETVKEFNELSKAASPDYGIFNKPILSYAVEKKNDDSFILVASREDGNSYESSYITARELYAKMDGIRNEMNEQIPVLQSVSDARQQPSKAEEVAREALLANEGNVMPLVEDNRTTYEIWQSVKELHPDNVLLVTFGDSVMSYGDDAQKISDVTGYAAIPEQASGNVLMFSISSDSSEKIVKDLESAGVKVTVVNNYNQELATQQKPSEDRPKTEKKPGRWDNIDYTKYTIPAGVEVKNAKVQKVAPKEGEQYPKWFIVADINGKHHSREMYYNDRQAFFEKDENGRRTGRATLDQLVAKYFGKQFAESMSIGSVQEAEHVLAEQNEAKEQAVAAQEQKQQEQANKEKEAQRQKEADVKKAGEEAAKKKAEEEKKAEKKDKVPAIILQSTLLIGALAAARENDGQWLNREGKLSPEFIQKGQVVSPFNALMMALHSDANGYKTNDYTTFNAARKDGYSVKGGETGLPFNWYNWDKYVNRFNANEIVSKEDYDKLPEQEKELYKVLRSKEERSIFNIDQTNMPQVKTGEYNFILEAQEKSKIGKEQETSSTVNDVAKQVEFLKGKHPDAVILMRNRDSYEVYGVDAEKCGQILGLEVLGKEEGHEVPYASFPHHELDSRLPKLVKAGARVAICDQLEDYRVNRDVYDRIYDKGRELVEALTKQERVYKDFYLETGYDAKEDVLRFNSKRSARPGQEVSTAISRLNDIYRAAVAYTGAEARLNRVGSTKMLPDDAQKYDRLVQELAAGVLMGRDGLPATLSKESLALVPYWERELKESPALVDGIERDVNNAVEVLGKIKMGETVDYAALRGQKAFEAARPKLYTIASELATIPSIEAKQVVIVKDEQKKSAAVILPAGASLEVNNEVPGMNKNRFVIALRKQGFEDVQFYNAGGALGLNQSNEFFADKIVEVAKLKQYELVVTEKLDLTEEIVRTSKVDIDNVQLVRDNKSNWMLYVKPVDGASFTVYPEPADVKTFFQSLRTQDFDAVRESLGQKYYALVMRHPDLKADVLMPEISKDVDVSRITKVNITKDKYKENTTIIFATIDNEPQKPVELTKLQAQRYWLVDDQDMYKLAVAAQIWQEKLNNGQGQSEDGQAQFRDHHEGPGIDNGSEVVEEKAEAERQAPEEKRGGIHF